MYRSPPALVLQLGVLLLVQLALVPLTYGFRIQNTQKRSSEKGRSRTNSRSFRLNFVEICLNVGILLPLPLPAEGLGRSLAFPLLPASTDGTSHTQRTVHFQLSQSFTNTYQHTSCKLCLNCKFFSVEWTAQQPKGFKSSCKI